MNLFLIYKVYGAYHVIGALVIWVCIQYVISVKWLGGSYNWNNNNV